MAGTIAEGTGDLITAVSGGRDSSLLIHLLAILRTDTVFPQKFRLRAIHIDHGIRSMQESLKDLDIISAFCVRLSVPLTVYREPHGRLKSAAASAGGLEAAARMLRYRVLEELPDFFQDTAGEGSSQVLLTAHHGDDTRETILLSLLEGSLGTRLLGIPGESSGVIRPFLAMEPPPGRSEINAVSEDMKIPFVEDVSNLESVQRRNFLRNRILPALDRHFGHMDRRLDALAHSWKEIHEYLERQVPPKLWENCPIPGREHFQAPVQSFCRLEPLIQIRSIKQILGTLTPPPREGRIPEEFFRGLGKMACRASGKGNSQRYEGYGLRFHLEYDRIYLYTSLAPGRKKRYFVPLNTGRESQIQPARGLTLIFTPVRRVAEGSGRGGESDGPELADGLFLRNLEDGESLKKYLKLPEKNEYLTLADLIRRRRIPAWMGEDVFLLEDGRRWYGMMYPDNLRGEWSFQPFYGGGDSRRGIEGDLRSNPELMWKYDIIIRMEQCW